MVGAKLLSGRAWAQVLTYVFDGLYAVLLLVGLAHRPDRGADVLTLLLTGGTDVLLALPPSRHWFRRVSADG